MSKPKAYLHRWTTFGHDLKGVVSLHPVACSDERLRVIGPILGDCAKKLKQGDEVETPNCRYVLGERAEKPADGRARRAAAHA